jgi:hypothetical protein
LTTTFGCCSGGFETFVATAFGRSLLSIDIRGGAGVAPFAHSSEIRSSTVEPSELVNASSSARTRRVQDFGTDTLTVRSDDGFWAAIDAGRIMARAYALSQRVVEVPVTVLRMRHASCLPSIPRKHPGNASTGGGMNGIPTASGCSSDNHEGVVLSHPDKTLNRDDGNICRV